MSKIRMNWKQVKPSAAHISAMEALIGETITIDDFIKMNKYQDKPSAAGISAMDELLLEEE